MTESWVKPVTLEGRALRLEPLTLEHAPRLFEAGRHADTFQHLAIPPFATVGDAEAFIVKALVGFPQSQVPFAQVIPGENRVVGSTRFFEIAPEFRRLEIGWTWLHPSVWRSAVNTTAKYLLLRHAFEDLDAERIELRTDILNTRSQAAIERIGGVREGVLRRYRIRRDGTWRDSVVFSIVKPEWPAVAARLLDKLGGTS